MARKTALEMDFSDIYTALVNKALRKNRTREEVDILTSWLTGYTKEEIENALRSSISYGRFLKEAPSYNERSERIIGKICGIDIGSIEDPLTKRMRQLDKLIDELAKGKALEKILR